MQTKKVRINMELVLRYTQATQLPSWLWHTCSLLVNFHKNYEDLYSLFLLLFLAQWENETHEWKHSDETWSQHPVCAEGIHNLRTHIMCILLENYWTETFRNDLIGRHVNFWVMTHSRFHKQIKKRCHLWRTCCKLSWYFVTWTGIL